MKHLETPEEIRQLRDQLAGHAVTGLMSRNWSCHRGTDSELFAVWASSSYALADKMLIARAAQPVITELLARLEAAETDAARYRFVKKSSMFCVAQWSDEDVDWFAIGEKQLDAPQVMEVNND